MSAKWHLLFMIKSVYCITENLKQLGFQILLKNPINPLCSLLLRPKYQSCTNQIENIYITFFSKRVISIFNWTAAPSTLHQPCNDIDPQLIKFFFSLDLKILSQQCSARQDWKSYTTSKDWRIIFQISLMFILWLFFKYRILLGIFFVNENCIAYFQAQSTL